MPLRRRKNRDQADDGAESPGATDDAVDPSAGAADDSDEGGRDPEGAHAGPPAEFGEEGQRAQGRHEATGRHAAGGGDNVDSTTDQGDTNRPADDGDQERAVFGLGRVVTHEQFVVEIPPGEDPEAYVRSIRDQIAQKFQGRPVQVLWEQTVPLASALGPGRPEHRDQIDIGPLPKHRGQINLPPMHGEAEQGDHGSPPPAQAPAKHRGQINLPPAQGQAEEGDRGSPPSASAGSERDDSGEVASAQIPPEQSGYPYPPSASADPEQDDSGEVASPQTQPEQGRYADGSPASAGPEQDDRGEMASPQTQPEQGGQIDAPPASADTEQPAQASTSQVPDQPEEPGQVPPPQTPGRPKERDLVTMPESAQPSAVEPADRPVMGIPEPVILVGNPRLGSAPGRPPQAKWSPPDSVLDGAKFGKFTVRAASLRGDEHRYSCDPRQDSIGLWALDRPSWLGSGGDLLLVCVADGVGNCPLSHIGSAQACALLRRHVKTHLEELTSAEWKSGCGKVINDVAVGLRDLADRNNLGPKDVSTTLIAGLVVPSGEQEGPVASALVFGVGDSPGFLLQERLWKPVPKRDSSEDGVHSTGTDALPTRPEMCWAETKQLLTGDMLMLCSDGLSGPMDNNENVCDQLADWWEGEPPSLPEFYWQMSFRAQTYGDDRSAVCVWVSD